MIYPGDINFLKDPNPGDTDDLDFIYVFRMLIASYRDNRQKFVIINVYLTDKRLKIQCT